MKPFHEWVSDMQGSIVDESHIGPPTEDMAPISPSENKKRLALPKFMGEWSPERIASYEKWMERMDN
jgi:hypothetical protein